MLWRHVESSDGSKSVVPKSVVPKSVVEVGLIHRPRYDDWTLPKGKAEPGETIFATAVREIAEETGHRAHLGRHLRRVTYDINESTTKHVEYWAARAVEGEFAPSHEVDEFGWFELEKARRRLTYRLDRKILAEFAALPPDLHTFLLIRHAKAGRRAKYRGDDALRPLEKIGRTQAQALAELLQLFGAEQLHAADRVRCLQTLGPLAEQLGTDVAVEPLLTEEAYRSDADATRARLVELARDESSVRALCSQGKVIAPAISWWADRDGVTLPANRNRKGSVWVISMCDGAMVAADHIASPLPPSVED